MHLCLTGKFRKSAAITFLIRHFCNGGDENESFGHSAHNTMVNFVQLGNIQGRSWHKCLLCKYLNAFWMSLSEKKRGRETNNLCLRGVGNMERWTWTPPPAIISLVPAPQGRSITASRALFCSFLFTFSTFIPPLHFLSSHEISTFFY